MWFGLPLLARSGSLLALLAGKVAFAPELFLESAQPLLLVVGPRGFGRSRDGRFRGGGRRTATGGGGPRNGRRRPRPRRGDGVRRTCGLGRPGRRPRCG